MLRWRLILEDYGPDIEYTNGDLVETMWLTRYHRSMDLTYDQGSEFIGHEFIKS